MTAVQQKVEAGAVTAAEIEMSLEGSKGALAVLSDNKSSEDQVKVAELVATINMDDTMSIIGFGVEAQSGLSKQSDLMIAGVRNKDAGPAAEVMSGLMLQIRGLGIDDLEEQGMFGRLFSKVTPLAKFLQKFETVESQIDLMTKKLKTERDKLIRDVQMLDGMYDEALIFFNELAYFIEACQVKLETVREVDIPKLEKLANKTNEMLDAQKLRDMVEKANDLERKAHDLELTRTVTMQLLPQIRMIQDVDKGLVTKLTGSVLTTIPLWKSQIAMAITLQNQKTATKAITAQREATDALLIANSEMLKQGNREAREEIEKGIVGIDAIKTVNENLIATIMESIEIAETGQAKRLEAQQDLIECEVQLKDALKGANSAATHALEA